MKIVRVHVYNTTDGWVTRRVRWGKEKNARLWQYIFLSSPRHWTGRLVAAGINCYLSSGPRRLFYMIQPMGYISFAFRRCADRSTRQIPNESIIIVHVSLDRRRPTDILSIVRPFSGEFEGSQKASLHIQYIIRV